MSRNVIEIIFAGKNQVSGVAKKIVTSFKDITIGAAKVGTALGVAATAGGGALLALANNVASVGDNVAKTARKLGVASDALQELRFAGELAGVETSTLDRGLQKLTINMADAANGVGEAKDAFKTLGISLRDNRGILRSSDSVLGDVADKFADLTDQTQKVNFAYDIFGRGGVNIVNLLNQGSAAISNQRKEFRELGGLLNKNVLKNSEDFIDAQLRLKTALKGVKNTIADALIPVFTPLFNKFASFIAQNRELIKIKFVDFIRNAVDVSFKFLSSLTFLEGAFRATLQAAATAGSAIIAFTEAAFSFIEFPARLGGSLFQKIFGVDSSSFLANLDNTKKGISDAGTALLVFANNQEKAGIKAAEATEKIKASLAATSAFIQQGIETNQNSSTEIETNKADEKAQIEIDAINRVQEAKQLAVETEIESERIKEEQKALTEAEFLEIRLNNARSFTEALGVLNAKDELAQKNKFVKLAEVFKKTNKAITEGFSRGIASMIVQGGSFRDTMAGIFKSVAANAISQIISIMITDITAKAAQAAAGMFAWFARFGPPGVASGVPAAVATKASVIAMIPALAKGGIVDTPTLAMIGEAGPEVVVPLNKLPEIVNNERGAGQLLKTIKEAINNNLPRLAKPEAINNNIFPNNFSETSKQEIVNNERGAGQLLKTIKEAINNNLPRLAKPEAINNNIFPNNFSETSKQEIVNNEKLMTSMARVNNASSTGNSFNVNIDKLELFPNVSTGEAILSIPRDQLESWVRNEFLPIFERLARTREMIEVVT